MNMNTLTIENMIVHNSSDGERSRLSWKLVAETWLQVDHDPAIKFRY